MIKSLVLKLVKKYAVSAIKDAVRSKGEEVKKCAEKVGLWMAKARLVVAFLERLTARLADGELTDAEIGITTVEVKILADEVMK